MQTKKGISMIWLIIGMIVGTALFKQFDFTLGAFKNKWLAALYFVTFAAAVFLLIKGMMNRSEK